MIIPVGQEPESERSKRRGVNFNGRRVSVTKADQDGMTAIATWFMYERAAGRVPTPTRLRFSNGANIVITNNNFDDLYTSWSEFRQSFFKG